MLVYNPFTGGFDQRGGAGAKLVPVANTAARLALTSAQVNVGDIVQQTDDGSTYLVIDVANLGNANGYNPLFTAAGFASLDLSLLPTSDPGGGKPWRNGGLIQVGA